MATSEHRLTIRVAAAALCLYGASLRSSASAELADGTPVEMVQADQDAPPDDPQSASELLIRITRLEDRLRSMTGQIEQLQFQNRKLEDNLRKMQQDVDFRFQDLGRGTPATLRPAPQKRGDAGTGDEADVLADASKEPAHAKGGVPAAVIPAPRRGDAFDPSASPNAPGAPKPLGTTLPSSPLSVQRSATPTRNTVESVSGSGPHAPLELMPNGGEPTPPPAGVSVAAGEAQPTPTLRAAPPPAGVASLAPGGTRSEYESDFALYKDGQFDAAATGFSSFLQKYPKDRLAADATYFLGEAYARLGRQREAAEQFLKLSTDYTRSSRAPDALLRLGIALNALGAKEQACATYQEVDRKFPTASADVRVGVERELKRSKC